MNKERIQQALQIINDEINSEETDTDKAIYQIYCSINSFIVSEIKRIIKEEGSVTKEHQDIAPLYRLFDVIIKPMSKYSESVRKADNE